MVDRSGSTIRGMFDMGALYEDLRQSIGKEVDLIITQTQRHCQNSASFIELAFCQKQLNS